MKTLDFGIEPRVTPLNRPFHEAARKGELRLQRCSACGVLRYPFAAHCPCCWADRYEWALLSGRGVVTGWGVYRRAFPPVPPSQVPYNVAQVALEEGPRLITNVVGVEDEAIHVGMPVEAVFQSVGEEGGLVRFRPQ